MPGPGGLNDVTQEPLLARRLLQHGAAASRDALQGPSRHGAMTLDLTRELFGARMAQCTI